MSAPENFSFTFDDEPHASRRSEILKKYPQIKDLYGPDPQSKYIITAIVIINLSMAVYLRDASWWTIIAIAYVFGGTLNHSLTLAVHELSHNLVFRKNFHNVLFGFFTCLPQGLPTFTTFKKYHLIHHQYQGYKDVDPDLPTPLEGKFFNTPIRKFAFLMLQPFFYSMRPMYLYPGDVKTVEIAQYIFQFTFDIIFAKYFGGKALAYLIISMFLGSGLHPLAAHFVAEHYIWSNKKNKKTGQLFETYSYYGPLNYLTFNVGYHNEHHDFPQIPGSKLHLLHRIAPEYYDEIIDTAHKSWVACMIRFVVDPTITPFARVIREKKVAENDNDEQSKEQTSSDDNNQQTPQQTKRQFEDKKKR